jgi:hypothetical protein
MEPKPMDATRRLVIGSRRCNQMIPAATMKAPAVIVLTGWPHHDSRIRSQSAAAGLMLSLV